MNDRIERSASGNQACPNLAQVFFRWPATRESEFNDSGNFHTSDLRASSSDPDTYRKSGFELRPNRECGEAPLSHIPSGFAAF